jgi:hypothetical protein
MLLEGPTMRVILLVLAAGGVAMLAMCKADQNAARRAAYAERQREHVLLTRLAGETTLCVRQAFRAHVTLDDFQADFGPVEPVSAGSNADKPPATHVYTHAATGQEFSLRFQDGRLVGFSSRHSSSQAALGPIRLPAGYATVEAARQWVAWLSVVGWAFVLIVATRRRAWRCGLIGLAGANFIAIALKPSYTLTWSGMCSNDMLFWSAVMVVASIVAVLIGQVARGQAEAPLASETR